ncbi:MAG: glycosyltransferase family 4 protein [Anaerolineae bacterium]|nr:glycosyltransferase family 4 protein [Anaerolineae bacterium]
MTRSGVEWPTQVDSFSNGVPVAPVIRQIWSRTKGYTHTWPDPHRVDGSNSFFDWLKSPVEAPDVISGGRSEPALFNNLALEVYRLRPDCQQRFPDLFGIDQAAYVCWFIEWAKGEQIAPVFYEAVEQALADQRRRPLRRLWRSLNRRFSLWVYTLYREERPLYRLYMVFLSLLEKIGISQIFVNVVADVFSEHNVLPLSIDRQERKAIIHEAEMGVNVIGFLRDESGIGRVSRDIIQALSGQSIPVAQIDLVGVPGRMQDYPELALPAGNPHAINLIYLGGLNQYFVRLLGEEKLLNRYNIAFLWWELNRFPPLLMDNLRIYNEVWVGSNFVKESLEPVLSVPVLRMPIIIPRPAPVSLSRSDLGLPEDKRIFLFVFDPYSTVERKNPQGFIEAYRRAFAPDFDESLLVLKTKGLDQFPAAASEIRSAVKSVGGKLINCSTSRAEIDALFAACDAYVSLHRSEGYGATLSEAMLHRKPVIATAYSGNMDFMTPENSYPVPYRLVELAEDVGPFTRGEHWADPDLDEAARLMKRVIEHPEEAREKALRGCADIEQRYSREAFSKAIIERLNEVHIAL